MSPGTTPASDLLAMSARTALSHCISSSSLGAQSTSVRFVVTILNVCFNNVWSTSSDPPRACDGGKVVGGTSYSNASNIWDSGICRCIFVSCRRFTPTTLWSARGPTSITGAGLVIAHHVTAGIHQHFTVEQEPSLPPIPSFAHLGDIAGHNHFRSIRTADPRRRRRRHAK